MSDDNDMNGKITPMPVIQSDQTGKSNRIVASINPLVFIEADDRFNFGNQNRKLTPEAVLGYLASETFIPEIQNIKKSYDYIAKNATQLYIVPAEYKILEKIIRPLKNALGSYIIGNAFETIALCGTVCEMITIFLFEINEITTKGEPTSDEEALGENLEKFETMGQQKRINLLHEFGLIDDDVKTRLHIVRKKRNEYLHKLSKNNDNIAPDAKESFDHTLDTFLKVSQLSIGNGKVLVNQKIIEYLRKRNLVKDVPDS